jgi:hypothetical protein
VFVFTENSGLTPYSARRRALSRSVMAFIICLQKDESAVATLSRYGSGLHLRRVNHSSCRIDILQRDIPL